MLFSSLLPAPLSVCRRLRRFNLLQSSLKSSQRRQRCSFSLYVRTLEGDRWSCQWSCDLRLHFIYRPLYRTCSKTGCQRHVSPYVIHTKTARLSVALALTARPLAAIAHSSTSLPSSLLLFDPATSDRSGARPARHEHKRTGLSSRRRSRKGS